MKRRNLLLVLLATCLTLSVPGRAPDLAAAEAVARMTLVEGTLKVRRAGKDLIYRRKGELIELSNGDGVQTGANSKARILLLAKEDHIDLASNSFLNVNNVSGDTRELGMPIGKAQFKVKPLDRPLPPGAARPFRIRTVNALVGVKGTEFVLGTGAEQTSLLTLEGSVTLANLKTPEVEVEVRQNQVAQITQSAPPTRPVEVSPQQAQNIVAADSPGAFSNVQFGEPVPTPSRKQEEKQEEKKEEKKEPAAQEDKAAKDPQSGGPGVPGADGPGALGASGGAAGVGEEAPPGGADGAAGPEGAVGPAGELAPPLDAPADTGAATFNFESGGEFTEFGAEFADDELGDVPLLEDDFFAEIPTDEWVQSIIDQVTDQVSTATETVTEQIQDTATQPGAVTIQINH